MAAVRSRVRSPLQNPEPPAALGESAKENRKENEMSPLRRRHVIPLTLATALGVAASTAAQIIDDFETGSFAFGPDSLGFVPVGPGHAVDLSRGVTTYGQTWATLGAAIGDDGVVVGGPEGWRAELSWLSIEPVDVTYGGAYDRFIVKMTASDSVSVNVYLKEGPSIYWGGTATIGNADPEILFDDIVNSQYTDFHQVTDIAFAFGEYSAGGLGSYATVWSIHVGRSAYGFASVDALNEQFLWCPGCPPDFAASNVSTGGAAADWQRQQRIADVIPPDPVRSVRVDCFDDGGDVGLWGHTLGNALYWESAPYSTSRFTLVTELAQTGAKTPTLASVPALTVVDSDTIALQYVVRVDDANSGALLGSSVETVVWDVFPGQNLDFKAVSVTPIEPALRGGVTGGVSVAFTLEAVGPVDIALPLVTSQTTADWAPGATPTAAAALARTRPAGLTAAPSVTRSGTRFVLADPNPRSSALGVFDVTGRRVRLLSFAAGAADVPWDGRGEGGASLPAGVYFAALPEANGPVAARVTLVR
jgi:hypothetical protein